jgi:hypothetical protein
MERVLRIKEIDGDSSFQNTTLQIGSETYLVIYGSGFLEPSNRRTHNIGDGFKNVAEARHAINKRDHPGENYKLVYCPTDVDFFSCINGSTAIRRLDVYCHGWLYGLNLGGFKGRRQVNSVQVDGDTLDWKDVNQDKGKDLRRVEIHEDWYLHSTETNELVKLSPDPFQRDVEVYFWGCNIGGQLSINNRHIGQNEDVRNGIPLVVSPKHSFAQHFATQIAKGSVYALVGKSVSAGSVFKTDNKGNAYYEDGEMLPANISENMHNMGTFSLHASDYMKKFPL